MECIKCQGLMVLEKVPDFFEAFTSWRCLNCGFVTDPLIMQNQRIRKVTPAGSGRTSVTTRKKEHVAEEGLESWAEPL